jgi:hypothetical protein
MPKSRVDRMLVEAARTLYVSGKARTLAEAAEKSGLAHGTVGAYAATENWKGDRDKRQLAAWNSREEA